MKERVRDITKRTGGRSIEQVVAELRSYLVGWKEYFRLADTPERLRRPRRMDPPPSPSDPPQALEAGNDDLPRAPRTGTLRERRRARSPPTAAAGGRTRAMLINVAFPISYFDQLGVPRLAA